MATASVAVRLNAITGEFEKAFTNATRTVSGFERTFGNAASSIQGHQQAMNRAFSEFSGDKITRDAAALSTAIAQIGGASKLTESEMRRVSATVQEAIAKYQALGQTAPKSLLELANATRQAEQPTSQMSKSVGFLQSTLAQFTAANLAATAIQNVTAKMTEFVSQGTKLPGLQRSFQSLTQSIGEDSASMLSTLQTSTRGLVSNIDLMQSANKAILLGLPVTNKEMGELAKTATVLGKAMGQDATKSLDDLITALGRSSPLILDNLGLTVKVGEANETYAAKLGKTVEAMTDAEKKTAFYEAAMEAARRKVLQLGEQTKTLGEFTQTAWVSIGNAVTETIADINTGIGAMISVTSRALSDVGGSIADTVRSIIGAREELNKETDKSAKVEKTWRDELNLSRTDAFLYMLQLGALADQMRASREQAEFLQTAQENLNKAIANAPKPNDVFNRNRNAQGETFDGGVGVRLNQFGRDVLDVSKYLKDYEKGLDDAKRAAERHAESLRKVNEKIADLKAGTRGLTAAQKDAVDDLLKIGLNVEDIGVKLGLSTTRVKQHADQWKEIQKAMQSVLDTVRTDVPSLLNALPKGSAVNAAAIPTNISQLLVNLQRDFAGIDLAALRASNAIDEFGANAAENTKRAEAAISENLRRIATNIDAAFAPLEDLAGQLPGLGGDLARFGVQAAAAFAKVAVGAMTAAQAVSALTTGVYGLIIQAGISAIGSIFREEPAATRQDRLDFEQQFGGRAGLEAGALLAGRTLGGFDMDATSAQFARMSAELTRQIEAQQARLEKYGLTWRDFGIEVRQAHLTMNASTLFRDFNKLAKAGADVSKVLTGMSGDLNQLIIDAVRTGTRIPGALGPMLRTLIETKQISEEAAAALLGIADDGIPALSDITAAAERYGLTLDQLGPKVQQLRINEAAKEIAADFKILTDAGADATVVAAAMAQKIQDILDISFKTGAEVPIALKPIIQILIEMGLLTDANGNKLENIDDINFGKDLVSAIDLLIERLNDLLDILIDVGDEQDRVNGGRPNLGGNPPSGPAIPRPTAPSDPNAPAPGTGGGVPGGRPNPDLSPSFTGSTADQSATAFTGGEVVPGGGALAPTATVILEMDGNQVAETVVPLIPGVVRRYGLV